MAKLSYKTKGNASPQGKERVYFACHPDDFKAYFEPVCADIFATQNCVIFYNSEPEKPWDEENMKLELGRMQLIVIPVTSRFLYKPNEARETEFAYAVKNHIPVLPLMQESGLEDEFNRVCGDLQFLDKGASLRDPTALPYEQKLEKYLKSVLLGDELSEKVRGAFDAYIFLSYRKKDRKYAQELMKLIHKNDFCRDIAIWYDEFLIPGENFNDAIVEAMTKSDLFTFVVTPNLLEPDNYVMKIEYPEARKAGKPILPAEMAETDKDELDKKFENIPDPTDAHDASALSEALSQGLIEKLRAIAIDENNTDPQHNFFIGLAYLGGIDVEVDHEKAVQLITFAAEHNLPEAMEKLADMYKNGEGVERNYETSAQWLDKLVEYWEKRFEKSNENDDGEELEYAILSLSSFEIELGLYDEARQMVVRGLDVSQNINDIYATNVFNLISGKLYLKIGEMRRALSAYKAILSASRLEYSTDDALYRDLLIAYGCIGDIYTEAINCRRALIYYNRALVLAESKVEESDEKATCDFLRDLATTSMHIALIQMIIGNYKDSKHSIEKVIETQEKILSINGDSDTVSQNQLAIGYEYLALWYESQSAYEDAIAAYDKACVIHKKLVDKTDLPKHLCSLSFSYRSIAEIYHEIGDLVQAKKYYALSVLHGERANKYGMYIEANYQISVSYRGLGNIGLDENDLEEARANLEKSLSLAKDVELHSKKADYQRNLAEVHACLTQLYIKLGQCEEALESTQICIEKYKNIPSAVKVEKDYIRIAENLVLLSGLLLEKEKIWLSFCSAVSAFKYLINSTFLALANRTGLRKIKGSKVVDRRSSK